MTGNVRSIVRRRSKTSVVGVVAVLLAATGYGAGWARASSIDAKSWQLQLRSTGYVFQSQGRASDAEKEDHFAFYQHFDGAAGSLVSTG